MRVSTDHQSTDLQRTEISRFILGKSWTVVQIYDDHLSGANMKRPGLQLLLADSRSKKFDVIVTYRLDRFFRSLRDLLVTLHELQELKIDFVSIRESIDLTTSTGRLMMHLLGAIGQFERELLNSRINSGLANAKRKGIKLGRPRTIIVHDVILLRKQGLSLGEIAKRLRCSKSAVHKTLSEAADHKSSTNTDFITDQNSKFVGHQSKDKSTATELPRSEVQCHEKALPCNEKDLNVPSDTEVSSK